MTAKHRSALSKIRCGVAPIRVETGSVENLPVNENDRLCPFCNTVEEEIHVLLDCNRYDNIRKFTLTCILLLAACTNQVIYCLTGATIGLLQCTIMHALLSVLKRLLTPPPLLGKD